MADAVERRPSLEDRIRAKLHESVSDLITEEDLRLMVDRGTEELLFRDRTHTVNDGWRNQTVTKPSIVREAVERELGVQMRTAVDAWLKDNQELVQKAIDDAIARGVGNAMLRAIDERFGDLFASGIDTLRNQGYLPSVPS